MRNGAHHYTMFLVHSEEIYSVGGVTEEVAKLRWSTDVTHEQSSCGKKMLQCANLKCKNCQMCQRVDVIITWHSAVIPLRNVLGMGGVVGFEVSTKFNDRLCKRLTKSRRHTYLPACILANNSHSYDLHVLPKITKKLIKIQKYAMVNLVQQII